MPGMWMAWWNRRIAVCADALTTKACGTRSQSLENAEHRGMGPPKRRCVSVTGLAGRCPVDSVGFFNGKRPDLPARKGMGSMYACGRYPQF